MAPTPESKQPARPVLSVAIRAGAGSDMGKLRLALDEAASRDPELRIERGAADGHAVLYGMSEAQLEAACHLIGRGHHIGLEVGEPQVLYVETIRRAAQAEGKYIRQSGGTGNYGHCKLMLSPGEPGSGIRLVNEMPGDRWGVPTPDRFAEFVEAIFAGVREALEGGILAGRPMVDVTAALIDGSHHPQDSNPMAFRIAASMATKDALRKANPVLLEPAMRAEIVAPEEFTGAIIADLNLRRGRIERVESTESIGGHLRSQAIWVTAPLAEMLGYANRLRTLTRAQGTSWVRFSHFEEMRRGWESGGDWSGAPARRPSGPGPRSGSATAMP